MRHPSLIRARRGLLVVLLAALLVACSREDPPASSPAPASPVASQAVATARPALPSRPIVYQLLPRLYGNRQQPTRPWGTIAENGVGRFADIDAGALASIRELGASHVWYTGVLRHALIGDYTTHGIPLDDPDVVKGRAGSPYAITDYYDVNPDLAQDPARRMDEFRALVARSHAAGLRVIIDIVPNHVARGYRSVTAPAGVRDFGADDDRTVEYTRENSFYYLGDTAFEVPEFPADQRPLGGEVHPLADGRFEERPARWTGNDVRRAQPAIDDWYETAKLNFGVRPDGTEDFPALPERLRGASAAEHLAFWQGQDVPRTWIKFREIVDFWLDTGVDGFRFDIAQMVPVPFWSYLNAHIKSRRPDALLIAEIYQPERFREYLDLGLMDLLYDKVDVYDGLKDVVQGKAGAGTLEPLRAGLADVDRRLLRFIENHDEQRVANPAFAGTARAGLPLMLYSGAIGRSATLLYFGQELGEPAVDNPGFGRATRTTIFDYWAVPSLQRWINDGAYDGGRSTEEERALRADYVRLMQFLRDSSALDGDYLDLHAANLDAGSPGWNDRAVVWARWNAQQRLLFAAGFDATAGHDAELLLPAELIRAWGLSDGEHRLVERLSGNGELTLTVRDGVGRVSLTLAPLGWRALELVP